MKRVQEAVNTAKFKKDRTIVGAPYNITILRKHTPESLSDYLLALEASRRNHVRDLFIAHK